MIYRQCRIWLEVYSSGRVDGGVCDDLLGRLSLSGYLTRVNEPAFYWIIDDTEIKNCWFVCIFPYFSQYLTNIAALLWRFTQGVYLGVLAGFSLSLWVFIGSVFYPPDTNPAERSVRGCSFYQDAQACAGNITLPCNNRSMEILAEYDDGLVRNPHKPYTE